MTALVDLAQVEGLVALVVVVALTALAELATVGRESRNTTDALSEAFGEIVTRGVDIGRKDVHGGNGGFSPMITW